MGFNLDDYEPVKDRITRFYADHKDGRILTELVTDPASLDRCAGFKAFVYIADIVKATGYAYEAQGNGVNRDSWVENAETSAIGRALANMDYCGTQRPSREEMAKVARSEAKPASKPEIVGSTPDNLKRAGELTVELSISKEEKARILAAAGNDVAKYIAKLEDMKAKRDAPEATFGTPEEQVAELFGGKK